MTTSYGDRIRQRRAILGLTQRSLAERSGVKQPMIASIESGSREPSTASRAALDASLALKPSDALHARREEVRRVFAAASLPEPRVFGSVARGDDSPRSDVDLLVEFDDGFDIADLFELEETLEGLLTFPVDLIDARATGRVVERARAEAVPL